MYTCVSYTNTLLRHRYNARNLAYVCLACIMIFRLVFLSPAYLRPIRNGLFGTARSNIQHMYNPHGHLYIPRVYFLVYGDLLRCKSTDVMQDLHHLCFRTSTVAQESKGTGLASSFSPPFSLSFSLPYASITTTSLTQRE